MEAGVHTYICHTLQFCIYPLFQLPRISQKTFGIQVIENITLVRVYPSNRECILSIGKVYQVETFCTCVLSTYNNEKRFSGIGKEQVTCLFAAIFFFLIYFMLICLYVCIFFVPLA